LAKFYHEWEESKIAGISSKPSVEKPWNSFTEDIKEIENEVLISHFTPDNLPKQSKKKLRIRGKIQTNDKQKVIYQKGDTIRGGLHQEGIYGAIKQEGEVVYVKRKYLQYDIQGTSGFKEFLQLDKIVDSEVKRKVKQQLNQKIEQGFTFKEAISEDIWMNEQKGIKIKKVRCITNVKNPLGWDKENRDKSETKKHKHSVHVVNEGNYMMAIYEGKDENKNLKRDFTVVNNLEAGKYFTGKIDNPIYDNHQNSGYPIKCVLKIGTKVILWENNPGEILELGISDVRKRLYKVIGLSVQRIKAKSGKINEYATIVLKHSNEARPGVDIRTQDGAFQVNEPYMAQRKLNHNQFNAFVEGYDFTLSPLGVLIPK